MGLDGIPTRIAHYFQDLPASPTSNNKRRIGLQLSGDQAGKLGLEGGAQPYHIDGTGYADCIEKAAVFIDNNFPGSHL